MAVTVASLSTHLGFIKNAWSANWSGCEEIVAAAAGKSIKLRYITISSESAINVTVGEGESGDAVESVILGPLYLAANSSIQFAFNPLLHLTAGKALTADASGAGNCAIVVQGFVE